MSLHILSSYTHRSSHHLYICESASTFLSGPARSFYRWPRSEFGQLQAPTSSYVRRHVLEMEQLRLLTVLIQQLGYYICVNPFRLSNVEYVLFNFLFSYPRKVLDDFLKLHYGQ